MDGLTFLPTITVDDLRAVGACDDGIREAFDRLPQPVPASMPVADLLGLVSDDDEWLLRAARGDGYDYGYGDDYGFGYGSGDGYGFGDGLGSGFGDGLGYGCYGEGDGEGDGDGGWQ